MKKTLLLAALALATLGTAAAQTTPAAVPAPGARANMHPGPKAHKTPAQKADHKAAKMGKELGLNPDQENRVEQILLAEHNELQALRAKAPGTPGKSGRGAEMKAVRAKYDAQLKAVLTPEQYTKLLAKRAEHHDDHKHDGKMKAKPKA